MFVIHANRYPNFSGLQGRTEGLSIDLFHGRLEDSCITRVLPVLRANSLLIQHLRAR